MVNLGGILAAIIIGGIAGWLASIVTKNNASMGLLSNIVVGILGAVVANLLFPLLGIGGTNGFTLWSLLVATLGAVILLFVIGLFRRKS